MSIFTRVLGISAIMNLICKYDIVCVIVFYMLLSLIVVILKEERKNKNDDVMMRLSRFNIFRSD